MRNFNRLALAASVIGLVLSTAAASAQSATGYYKGKQVTIVVGSEAGSGYDAYARVLARHIGRHLPGQPSVIVEDMPGAVSRQAANFIENIAPKDGTVIGAMVHSLVMDELLGAPGIHFRSRALTWLGSVTQDLVIGVAWHSSPVKTIEQAMQHEMIVGGVADSLVFPKLMNAVLGTKFKVITGYRGGADLTLAMERGEIEGRMGWAWASIMSSNPDWIRTGQIIPMVQFSTVKHPALPNVPLITQFVRDDDDRALLELVFSREVLGKPFIAASGLAPQAAAMLRKSFDETMKDPKFLADMQRTKLDVNPMSGAQVQALITRLFDAKPAVVERAKAIIPVEH